MQSPFWYVQLNVPPDVFNSIMRSHWPIASPYRFDICGIAKILVRNGLSTLRIDIFGSLPFFCNRCEYSSTFHKDFHSSISNRFGFIQIFIRKQHTSQAPALRLYKTFSIWQAPQVLMFELSKHPLQLSKERKG